MFSMNDEAAYHGVYFEDLVQPVDPTNDSIAASETQATDKMALLNDETFSPEGTPATSRESAARRFASTYDLLMCISDVLHNREALATLCRANKFFNAVFSQKLYSDMVFDELNVHLLFATRRTHGLNGNWRLGLTKAFTLSVSNEALYRAMKGDRLGPSKPVTKIMLAEQLNEAAAGILCRTPALKSFKWIGESLFPSTLEVLRVKCPNLASLSVVYPRWMEVYGKPREWFYSSQEKRLAWEKWERCSPYRPQQGLFTGFRKLRVLDLHGIYGNLDTWLEGIVDMLVASPDLQEFGLSISPPTLERMRQLGKEKKIKVFVRKICSSYEKRAAPLRLRSLALTGCCPPLWGSLGAVKRCLGALTDLDRLEKLEVSTMTEGEEHLMNWDILAADTFPSLRELSLHGRLDTFRDACGDGTAVRAFVDGLGGLRIGSTLLGLSTRVPGAPALSDIASGITNFMALENSPAVDKITNYQTYACPGSPSVADQGCLGMGRLPLPSPPVPGPIEQDRLAKVENAWLGLHRPYKTNGGYIDISTLLDCGERIRDKYPNIQYYRLAWVSWARKPGGFESLDRWEDQAYRPDFFDYLDWSNGSLMNGQLDHIRSDRIIVYLRDLTDASAAAVSGKGW